MIVAKNTVLLQMMYWNREQGRRKGKADGTETTQKSTAEVRRARDAWVAQSDECPTLDFGSGHGPRVVGSSPALGSMLSAEPA